MVYMEFDNTSVMNKFRFQLIPSKSILKVYVCILPKTFSKFVLNQLAFDYLSIRSHWTRNVPRSFLYGFTDLMHSSSMDLII